MTTPVGGATNAIPVQTPALTEDVQSIISDGLNRLNSGSFPSEELVSFFGQGKMDQWKAPVRDAMNELANRQPPLTADEAKAEVGKLLGDFEFNAAFMKGMFRWMYNNMLKLIGQASKTWQSH